MQSVLSGGIQIKICGRLLASLHEVPKVTFEALQAEADRHLQATFLGNLSGKLFVCKGRVGKNGEVLVSLSLVGRLAHPLVRLIMTSCF